MQRILDSIQNRPDHYILPFFWQHGEPDDILLRELHKIYDSGIRAVCIESRPHEDFVGEGWWSDMDLLLAECEKLGMELWLLDDKHFPTGEAAGLLDKKYPHLGKKAITERHMDVCGPIADGCTILDRWLGEKDTLLGVVACKREPDGQKLTGETIDLSENVHDNLVYFDLPEGVWRIFYLLETLRPDTRIDVLNPESVDVLIEAVYQPHFEHYGDKFGKTFRGFFSDEPYIMWEAELPLRGDIAPRRNFPWNSYVQAELERRHGADWLRHMPGLWFPMTGHSPKLRVDYMESVTTLYSKHFCYKLGEWSRAHSAEYIGHIVEDANRHSAMNSGGHYFRALDGQDMAGIDVVLCQIVPGMSDHTITVPCSYDVSDPAFFHYGLAKLGASHAHIQPAKKGRAMCEIYGAYGWAEGLKMMKWLTDHMLVRGINHFVPHAFTPKYPDYDCPPYFYNAGHNPQYRDFRLLMEYMDRCCHVLTGGRHHASAAILYHAQAEWSGGEYMYFHTVAKALYDAQLDFDILPEDYLLTSQMEEGKLRVNAATYPCFIVPYAQYLPASILNKLDEIATAGVPVIYVDGYPEKTVENGEVGPAVLHASTVPLSSLSDYITRLGFRDVELAEPAKLLRTFHISRGDTHVYMLFNEDIHRTVSTDMTFSAFAGGAYMEYDAMENRAVQKVSDGPIRVEIPPYQSRMLIFGHIPTGIPAAQPQPEQVEETVLTPTYEISLATEEEYPAFRFYKSTDTLPNITGKDGDPRFGGHMQYKFTAVVEDPVGLMLDLGNVGETAELTVNGRSAGVKLVPPYRFEIGELLKAGENDFCVRVTNHLGYNQRDYFSQFLMMEPSGLLGPVKLLRQK